PCAEERGAGDERPLWRNGAQASPNMTSHCRQNAAAITTITSRYHSRVSTTQRRSRFASGAGRGRSPLSMVRARVAKNIGAVTDQLTMHQGHSALIRKIAEIARKCT